MTKKAKPPYPITALRNLAAGIAELEIDELDLQVADTIISYPGHSMNWISERVFGRPPNFVHRRLKRNGDIKSFLMCWGMVFRAQNWCIAQPEDSVNGSWIDAVIAATAELDKVRERAL